ncbi:MAG TPA: site-specific integrase [Actinomycetota bacterium]|nr:site-specific integrase [Actinomycetota bacterium]
MGGRPAERSLTALAHIQKVTTKGGRTRFQARYIDPAGRERAKNFITRAEARAFVVEMESRKRRGEWMAPELGRRTFGEWAEHVEASRINLRDNPRLRDAWILKDLILPTFEQVPIAAIHQDLVQGWVKKLSQAGYAATTVKKAYQTFARIMAAAVGKRIARTPCVDIVLPADDSRPMRILTEDEIFALADAMPGRYRALVLTAAYTGLRIGELAALRVRHVNFPRRVLAVEETLTEPQGHVQFGPPKTKAGRRTISVPAAIVDELASHVAAFVPDGERNPGSLIFAGERGGPMRPNHFRRRTWAKAVKESVGLPCHPHDLRHSHASILIKLGVHPKTIQVRLGHTSIRTTMDIYGHLYEGVDEAAAQALDALFRRALETVKSRPEKPLTDS